MDKRIIVIHSSVIVQKGIQAVLRDSINVEFLFLNSIRELDDYESIANSLLVLLVEENFTDKVDEYVHKLELQNNQTAVLFLSNNNSINENVLLLSENQSSIIKKVKALLEPAREKQNEISELTERERDVLKHVALGHQNKEIADMLFISIHTVISHRKNITEKLGIKSISGLTVYAILNKLIDTENIDPSTLI